MSSGIEATKSGHKMDNLDFKEGFEDDKEDRRTDTSGGSGEGNDDLMIKRSDSSTSRLMLFKKALMERDPHSNESILEQVYNENIRNKQRKRKAERTESEEAIEFSNKSHTEEEQKKPAGFLNAKDLSYQEVADIQNVNQDDDKNYEKHEKTLQPQDDSKSDDIEENTDEIQYSLSSTVKYEISTFLSSFPTLEKSYKILDKIGEGTFSSVYLAKRAKQKTPQQKKMQKRESELVALKRIYVTSSPQRIYNELNLLHNLMGHRNIASLLDILRFEDQVIAVLPYFEHADFRDFYRDLPLIGIQNYIYQLLEGLKFIHYKGIIHRDIKPTNFLYNPIKRMGVLVDFGLAEIDTQPISNRCPCYNGGLDQQSVKQLNGEMLQFPKNGYLKDDQRPGRRANRAGTRGFRAPEVLFKCNNQNKSIDIWSVGVMLLTLLSRRFPFFNSADDIDAIMEITNIFGIKKMKQCALIHGLEFDCNISNISTPISFQKLITSALVTDCKEGDTFAEDSPAWEFLTAFDDKHSEIYKEYHDAVDLLEKCLTLNAIERPGADELLQHPFFHRVKE